MSKHPYGANPEMLLLLAWLSTLDLSELSRKDRKELPWKYPSYRPSLDQSQQPSFPERIIQEQVELALHCFRCDPIFGPVLEALARDRLTYVEFFLVAWAIELQGLADPSAGLFFSDNPYSTERQQKTDVVDETDAFWRVACSHVPLMDHLKRLSTTWHGDVCFGAGTLHAFFIGYLELIRRPLQLPFFLREYVHRSLVKIDWHAIASNLLEVPRSAGGCQCAVRAQETATGERAEYLCELFKATGDEIMSLSQCLPEPERMQALLIGDLCHETTKAMCLFFSYERKE
jgi:hypothetical protein